MRCAIDGKVMVNPVRPPVLISGATHGTLGTWQVLSRYGHHFERKTLEKWFGNCGSVVCSDEALYGTVQVCYLCLNSAGPGVSDHAKAAALGGVSTRSGDEKKAQSELASLFQLGRESA